MIVSEDEHSWINMIKEGATTWFEVWGKEQKENTSLCHPWASAPIIVILEDLIGLNPGKPGWKTVSFTPHMPENISRVSLKIPVRSGEIFVEYINDKKIYSLIKIFIASYF